MAFLSSKRLRAFSFPPLLYKSLIQEFCAHLHQGKNIFQSNTNSVYFSLRLACLDKKKKLKKNSLWNSANIDPKALLMTQPRSFKNERFIKVNEYKTLDLSKFAPKQSQHPQSKTTPLIRIEKGNADFSMQDWGMWIHEEAVHPGTSKSYTSTSSTPQTSMPHPFLYCTLKGTFIHLFASPMRRPKLFPKNTKPGGWGAHNQSLLRQMIILDAPWKRETPSEWLVPRWVSPFTQISLFSALNVWVLLWKTGIVPATNGVSI